MTTVLVFIILLGILVFVHELGHFLAARKSGMAVHEFAIGFPPFLIGFYIDPKTKKRVWVTRNKAKQDIISTGAGISESKQFHYPNTLYALNLLPLGGYVKIKGENGEMDNEKDSFGAQKAWKRIVVLVAGVTMNFLFAAFLLAIGFMTGLPTDVSDGVPPGAEVITEPVVSIQQVMGNSAAEDAGLKLGDKIITLDNESVKETTDVINYVKENGTKEMALQIERKTKEGETIIENISVTPRGEEGETPKMGIMLVKEAQIKYPWYKAIWMGLRQAVITIGFMFMSFFLLFKSLIFGGGVSAEVAGPVGIATIVGDSYRLGMAYLINVATMISLSLAVINILPIPALDGGRVVFVLLEKIMGKKVPIKYEQIAHMIGFSLLMLLILIVTVRDVMKLF